MSGRPQRLLTFRGGGWVLALAAAFTALVVLWALSGTLLNSPRLAGDGRNVETYGFDLSTCLVPRDLLVAGGVARDAIPALVDPATVTVDEVAQLNAKGYGKFLVSSDRVIGVEIGGEARAYPLLIMKVHEVANDVLGGVPIAVTYNPLCDSVVVVEREVEGEVLEFGVSGLLYNSNLLMYDRRPEGAAESLWSQLQARAITGPAAAAGRTLRLRRAALVSWDAWRRRHPDTTVLDRVPRLVKRYRETQYDTYFASPGLMFPVRPRPPEGGPDAKDRVVVVMTDDDRRVYALPTIARKAGSAGLWETGFDDVRLRFRYGARPAHAAVTASDGTPLTTAYAFWFAWHAMYPDDRPVGY